MHVRSVTKLVIQPGYRQSLLNPCCHIWAQTQDLTIYLAAKSKIIFGKIYTNLLLNKILLVKVT